MKNTNSMRYGKTLLLVLTVMGAGMLLSGCQQDPSEGLRDQGLLEYNQGDYNGALDKFNQALKYNESEPRANYYAGEAEFKLGKFEEAAYYFKLAWTIDPNYGDVKSAFANTLIKQGKVNEAMNFLEREAAMTGTVSDRLRVARFYQQIGDLDDAQVNYARSVAMAPDDTSVLIEAGKFYDGIGQKDQAIAVYKQAYLINPTTPGLVDLLEADGVLISDILPVPPTTAPAAAH